MFDFIALTRAILFAVLYGLMENRYFFEEPPQKRSPFPLFGKFKRYHVMMLGLFAATSFTTNIVQWLGLLILMIFLQDSSWQLIGRRKLTREDWSNLGSFPLVFGTYVWYYPAAIGSTAILILSCYL
jgi:hypothetical protein